MAEMLKPCPFCGGEAKLVTGTRRDGEYVENCAFVRCERCGAKTYELHECMTPYEVQKCATELWNERAERTCRMGAPIDGEYRCGECGHLNRETYRADKGWYPPEYCAHCGARVVEGDA